MGVCFQDEKNEDNLTSDPEEKEKEKKNKKNKKNPKHGKAKYERITRSKKSKNNEEENKILNTMNEEQTKIYLETIYNSYYASKTYFNENELKEKELEAINCCKKIIAAQDMLKEGKCKKINMGELPKKMTSEFITGYTPEERKKKINEIIERLNQERIDTKKILNNNIEEMKKIFTKLKDSQKAKLKQDLDKYQNHINFIAKEIDIIKKTLISDYIPIPLVITTNQAYKKEKFNLDIKENTMKIKVNGISYTKSNPVVLLGIKGDNNLINVKKEIKGKNQEDIYDEFIWEFNENQFKNLVRYNLEIVLGRNYTIKATKAKGKGELQLRKLKDRSYLEENVKLKMISGKSDTDINIEIFLRNPLVDKEYEEDFREIIKIEKIYPEFKFKH